MFAACSSSSDNEPAAAYEQTSEPEEELYQEAQKSYEQGLYSLSMKSWGALRDSYPGGYYSATATLKIADCQFYLKNYEEAVAAYEEFLTSFPTHEATPYAKFQVANAYLQQYDGPLKDQGSLLTAIKHLQNVIKKYPEASFAAEAEAELREAREQQARHEAVVAKFYLKQGLYEASFNRYRTLVEDFSDTVVAQKEGKQIWDLFHEEELISEDEILDLPTPMFEADVILARKDREEYKSFMGSAAAAHEKMLKSGRKELELSPLVTSEESVVFEEIEAIEEEVITEGSMISRVDCIEKGGNEVITAYLEKLIEPQTEPNRTDKKVVSVSYTAKHSLSSKTLNTQKKCSDTGSSIKLTEIASGDKTLLNIDVKLAHAGAEYSIFSLDKPSRVVAIVSP